MSGKWFRKGPSKRELEAREMAERCENTCPNCLGDKFSAGISIGNEGRRSFRRCMDCHHEPGSLPRVGLTEEEREAIEWEFGSPLTILGL